MINTTTLRIFLAVFLIAVSLVFVSGAPATTENECINAGGSVSEGSGCKFCVGGKFDLSEITYNSKNNKPNAGPDQKMNATSSSKTGNGPLNRTPADNRM